jgi:hypothetical protein
MPELNGTKITVKRLDTNRYCLINHLGQSIEITATAIMEIAAFARVESETLEADADHDTDVWQAQLPNYREVEGSYIND